MNIQLFFILFFLTTTIIAVSYIIFIRISTKQNILRVIQVLRDIQKGNGNRRILIKEKNILAPLIFEMNEIIQSYTEKILEFNKAENANKQLMTSLSHDVRTPLTTLIGYLDAVNKKVVSGIEKEEYLSLVQQKAYDLKEYIDVLFEWFKLNSNEIPIHLKKIEVGEATREILIEWIPTLDNQEIAFDFDVPDEPFYGKLDLDGYRRIINNLIQNILSHSGANNVTFSIKTYEKEFKIFLSDDGVGIEKKDIDYIFERLYKVDKGRTRRGSGLGLSIVHELVNQQNGTIHVNSEINKGTTFEVIFPSSI